MVTIENAPQYIPEILSEHVPTHCETTQPPNMIRQLSRETTLAILENTKQRASNDHSFSTNKLAETIAGVASQQRPTAFAILKPASTTTFFFDGKNETFGIFENFFHSMLKMQSDMIEAI